RWELIVIDGGAANIELPSGEISDSVIVGLPSLYDRIGGTTYTLDTDYTYEAGAFTWLIADPGEEAYMAERVYIETDIIDKYYNTGVFDMDVSIYDDPGSVIYACMHHLSSRKTLYRASNLAAILAGIPFSKYYGEFKLEGANCVINYDVVINTLHRDFINEHELHGYVYIDYEKNLVYDEYIPEDAGELHLCHKSNLTNIDGKYDMAIRSETHELDGDIAYESGELCPISLIGELAEQEIEQEYDKTVIPLYSPEEISGHETEFLFQEDAEPLIQEVMRLYYGDNANIPFIDVKNVSETELKIADNGIYPFKVGDKLILIGDDDARTPATILSGAYNSAEKTYLLRLNASLDMNTVYDVVVPRVSSCLIPVQIGARLGQLTVILGRPLVSAPFCALQQAPDGIYAGNVDSVLSYTWEEHYITVAGDILYDVGDAISVTRDGEQDYYSITDIDGDELTLYPPPRREYVAGDKIYNMRGLPRRNMVRFT
ncbi:MAG: hypothetical protein Q8M92_08785, partial [Candidatus Subteraquimicrobiales bacterium]|nr:hypothetical protein [Candidatus Subteraquimicrobiales bacterium]